MLRRFFIFLKYVVTGKLETDAKYIVMNDIKKKFSKNKQVGLVQLSDGLQVSDAYPI